MAIYNALTRLKVVYHKLEEGFYSSGDYPLSDEKFISHDTYISISIFEELQDIIMELDDLLDGSLFIEEVLTLIEEDTPISNLVTFNEQHHVTDLTNENPESHDEEKLSSVQEQAFQSAAEIKSDLTHEAHEDIKILMGRLLPLLIE